MDQLLAADKMTFVKISGRCRTGVQSIAGAPMPMDVAMKALVSDWRIMHLLQPLPAHGNEGTTPKPHATGSGHGPPEGVSKRKLRVLALEEKIALKKASSREGAGSGQKGKGTGKGKA